MPNLTRRSFVELVSGVLASLPVVAGGLVLAPKPAHAADEDYHLADIVDTYSPYVVIDVVKFWEVGFMVVDLTKGTKNDAGQIYYPPVPGAKIVVTSLFNNNKIEVTTGDDGVANVDIRSLSVVKEGEDVDNLKRYRFYGNIQVSRDGYRSFETGKMTIEGGKGLRVPTCPLDEDTLPYPHYAHFNDWDILYTKNAFVSTDDNDMEHELSVSTYIPASVTSASFELWVRGEKSARMSQAAKLSGAAKIGSKLVSTSASTSASSGTAVQTQDVMAKEAKGSFKGLFLKKGDGAALPVGCTCLVAIVYGGKRYAWRLGVIVQEGVVAAPIDKENVTLKPIPTSDSSSTGLSIPWPDSVPIVGGSTSETFSPVFPINVYINPFGLVQITYRTPSWGYTNDSFDSNKAEWGTHPLKGVFEEFDEASKDLEEMKQKASDAWNKKGTFKQVDMAPSISALVYFQGLALASWNSEDDLFQGEAAAQLCANVEFSITENFFVGPFPILVTFSLGARFSASLACACYSFKKEDEDSFMSAIVDLSRWSFDYSNTGLTLSFSFVPSLSVGIGIRGVASVSIKGSVVLTLALQIPIGTMPDGLPSPHSTAGWSAEVVIIIEFFLWTKTFVLYDKEFSNFYDNWEGKDPGVIKPEDKNKGLAEYSMKDVVDQLRPITDEMLLSTREVSITYEPVLGSPEEVVEFDWESYTSEVEGHLENGTSIMFVAYDLDGASGEKSETSDETASASGETASASGETASASGETSSNSGLVAFSSGEDASDFAESSLKAFSYSNEYETEWTKDMAAVNLPAAGVASLGANGGIHPSSDERLFVGADSHVLGASHLKVVQINAGNCEVNNWCFRIASVSVYGEIRTRLLARCIKGPKLGVSHIFEFSTSEANISHDMLYDYDFDVCTDYYPEVLLDASTNPAVGPDKVIIVILSGKRDRRDSMVESTATDIYFTAIQFDARALAINADVLDISRLDKGSDESFTRTGAGLINDPHNIYHSLSCVQISPVYRDPFEGGANYSLITFLDRSAATREAVMTETANVRLGIMFMAFNGYQPGHRLVMAHPDNLMEIASIVPDQTIYEVAHSYYDMSKAGYGVPLYVNNFMIMMRGSQKCHYFMLGLYGLGNGRRPDGEYFELTDSIAYVGNCYDLDPSIRLVPCRSQHCYFTSYPTDAAELKKRPEEREDYSSWALHRVKWWQEETGIFTLHFEPVGPSGFNVVNFAVSAGGDFIFWPQKHSATVDRTYELDGTEEERNIPASYTLYACRIRGSKFSDPFIVADLEHDVDFFTPLPGTDGAVLDMISSNYVDVGEHNEEGVPIYHAADIWFTSIPSVRCATATACKTETNFVAPGGTLDFDVAVRNDGNVYLSGCELTLCLHNSETDTYERVEGCRVKVPFNSTTIRESRFNLLGEDGKLMDVEDDFALAPGKTSVYNLSVKIPENWTSGSKKVLFVAENGDVSTMSSALFAFAESESGESTGEGNDLEAMEFHIEPGEYNVVGTRTAPTSIQATMQRHMETLVVDATVDEAEYTLAPLTVYEEGSRENPGNSTDDAGDTSSSSGTPSNPGKQAAGSGSPATGTKQTPGSGSGSPATGTKQTPGTGTAKATTPGQTSASTTGATSVTRSAASTATAKSSSLPDTSDHTSGSALGAGLALLGGAIVAYERRRAENEDKRG